ncbi:hypothetical protein B0T13DRAFT_445570 [Neurospora crassa]|nr:hypothetical protein B0T13DRAFT_445570 [Neurospora crassa]
MSQADSPPPPRRVSVFLGPRYPPVFSGRATRQSREEPPDGGSGAPILNIAVVRRREESEVKRPSWGVGKGERGEGERGRSTARHFCCGHGFGLARENDRVVQLTLDNPDQV